MKVQLKKKQYLVIVLAVIILCIIAAVPIIIFTIPKTSELTSIEISSLPNKTEYIEKQTIDTTGLEVLAFYGKKSVKITDYKLDKKVLKLGDKSVTVSYTNKGITKTAEFAVSVSEKVLSAIEIIKKPNKLTYIENTEFDSTGIEVEAIYNNGERISITNFYIDKNEKLQLSDKVISVSYSERGITKSADIEINVTEKEVTELEIVTPPNKNSYLEGTYFDPSGMVIKAYYNNGEEKYITDWEYDNVPLKISDKYIAIRYGGQAVNVEIEVDKKILISIMASGSPEKIVYTEGEYFDILGIEIYANYKNAPTELIYTWDYDKKNPLQIGDKEVTISYTLHGISKTITFSIVVNPAPVTSPEQEMIDKVIELLPPTDELTSDNLSVIDYALSVLNNATELSDEQKAKKAELEAKRQEIIDSLPPVIEQQYSITYKIANDLAFADINYGGNPLVYKNSEGEMVLNNASSTLATQRGYEFAGWLMQGQKIDKLTNLSTDVTLFALFELTETANIIFKDYDTRNELFRVDNTPRTDKFDFESFNIGLNIYQTRGVLAIAYYSVDGARITSSDLSFGSEIEVFVITAQTREMHLSNYENATVGWKYNFRVNNVDETVEKSPTVGSVFVVPIGAEVTITALNANISDILIDGVSKGENLNNSVIKAVYEMVSGEYPVSVTFSTRINDMVTLSFLGTNHHSVVYPADWDGYIDSIDLERIAFIFDESNKNYITVYTIDGIEYYFEDLSSYEFTRDTEIWVSRVRNSFSITIHYNGGTEKIDGLKGKQPLNNAFAALDSEALVIMNSIFAEGNLFSDKELTNPISAVEQLNAILKNNIVLYSDWTRPLPPPPDKPDFGEADYEGLSFIKSWQSMFLLDGDIYASSLTLTADGYYTYKTHINGVITADINGIYRYENGVIVLITFELANGLQLVEAQDLKINIEFAEDGLLMVTFISIIDTEVTLFDHTLTCGNVKPVNYAGQDFIGVYQYNGVEIELRINGTAILTYQEIAAEVYYRVTHDGKLIIFNNGIYGTGEIVGIFGGNE